MIYERRDLREEIKYKIKRKEFYESFNALALCSSYKIIQ